MWPTAVVLALALGALAAKRRDVLTTLMELAASRNKKKTGKAYLTGNYAPVPDEQFQQDLPVEGAIPAELDGVYLRNGPNPYFEPKHGYHWFDGDGMLHATRLCKGTAAYANHFVVTSRLEQEKQAGRPLFVKLGDLLGGWGLVYMLIDALRTKVRGVNVANGAGTANTALAYHARSILALNEGDLPYVVRVACEGLVETLGRIRPAGWAAKAFTAHPKLDPETGELCFFGYSVSKAPYVRAGIMDAAGTVTRQWVIDTPYPAMMHDMAITKNHIILMHLPLVFDPQVMVKSGKIPFIFRKDLPARFGLLRRDSPNGQPQITWIELPACMVFHVFNAYEDDQGNVKMYTCHFNEIDLGLEEAMPEAMRQHVYEYTLCPGSATGSMRQISASHGDFPVIHPGLTGRKARYGWMGTMTFEAVTPTFVGISKIDFDVPEGRDGCVAQITFPAGCYGGEAVFVPRHAEVSKCNGEDDGFLLVYVYHTDLDTSKLHIYDARTMDSKPLAMVKLPRRVPYGFHGMYVTGDQLKTQKQAI